MGDAREGSRGPQPCESHESGDLQSREPGDLQSREPGDLHDPHGPVVFCIDDKPAYLMLLRVAARSLRAVHPHIRCVCVYSGSNAGLMAAVRAEGVELALRPNPVLNRETIPPSCHYALGAYLKLELALVPELEDEKQVLYCDSDVLFLRPLDSLLALSPPYLAMAREASGLFCPDADEVDYEWRGQRYVLPAPFPLWSFSSGVVLFNLERLRAHGSIHNFLAFCQQTTERIGNLDQSLINYFFGKRISKLDSCWNRPPYHHDCLATAHIVHFHGLKPWDSSPAWDYLRINDFMPARDRWLSWLTGDELRQVRAWQGQSGCPWFASLSGKPAAPAAHPDLI